MLEPAEEPHRGQTFPLGATQGPVHELALSTLEAVWLSDNIRGPDVDDGDPDQPNVQELIGRALLEKVGSVFLELVPEDLSRLNTPEVKNRVVPINITLAEAWLIRDKVRTGDLGFDNTTNIGIPLLRKAYAVILASEDIAGMCIQEGDDRTLTPEQKSALTLLYDKEKGNAES